MKRRFSKLFVLSIASTLALSACQDKASKADGSSSGAAEGLKPGKWQVGTKLIDFKAVGFPPEMVEAAKSAQPPANNSEACLSEAEARQPFKAILADAEKNCRSESFEMSGGKITGKFACTGGGMKRLDFDGTYGPEAFKLTTSTEMDLGQGQDGKSLTGVAEVVGKRIGECNAAAAK